MALAAYLTLAIGGLAPVVSEAIADGVTECCSDCSDPGCPEHDERECPPQCDDCVCPCWAAPAIDAVPAAVAAADLVEDGAPSMLREVVRRTPVLPGVFRPPRA